MIEYRLVRERPSYQNGKSQRIVSKRDYTHARESLEGHYRDMIRYEAAGIEPWHAWIEEREVSEWIPI
jgi:hypothetical protein